MRRFVSAAGAGWWLGFGYFVAGLWWMGAAMLVEADQFAWALPLAVFGLPAVLALFPAAGFALARLLWSPGGARVFALAAGLGAAEWLRGHLFTGFPWNDFGMALTSAGPMAQTASLVGLHGLDIIAIVIFAAPATLIDRAPRGARRIGGTMLAAAALAMLMFAYGVFRLGANKTEYVDGVALRLMQPNLPQDAKFRPENGAKILRHYLDLSERATNARPSGLADVTHLVWPESGVSLCHFTPPGGARGDRPRAQGRRSFDRRGAGRRRWRRTAGQDLQFDRGAQGRVDRRLLRQGSSRPLRRISAARGSAAAASKSITSFRAYGTAARVRAFSRRPVCRQLRRSSATKRFSRARRSSADAADRPRLFLNVTNDGWFGHTTGPYQHLAQARLRAIEEGLPMIRVANTGVSAIIDAYGRILQSLPLGEEGLIDGRLPREAAPTVFAAYGALAFPALLALATAMALLGVARRQP